MLCIFLGGLGRGPLAPHLTLPLLLFLCFCVRLALQFALLNLYLGFISLVLLCNMPSFRPIVGSGGHEHYPFVMVSFIVFILVSRLIGVVLVLVVVWLLFGCCLVAVSCCVNFFVLPTAFRHIGFWQVSWLVGGRFN